jgi:hypothetical protein
MGNPSTHMPSGLAIHRQPLQLHRHACSAQHARDRERLIRAGAHSLHKSGDRLPLCSSIPAAHATSTLVEEGSSSTTLKKAIYCVGGCWALMLLLVTGGVMNLTVIAALTAFVAFEKLAPLGMHGARISACS